MKACVLTDKNILEVKNTEIPQINTNEVLIKVKACGICSSDYNRVFNGKTYYYPIILGHEFSGIIIKTGGNVDPSFVGKKVTVFPLLPCNKCEACNSKRYAQCSNYSYLGSRENGAMAEYVKAPIWNIKILPDNMSFLCGALCEPTAVAINAITKAGNIRDKDVCICGSGIIGIMAGLYAQENGTHVYFNLRNDKKIPLLKSLGFNNFIVGHTNKTFDCVIECVGSISSINKCIALVKSQGTIVLVGNPESDIQFDQKTYWKILRSELQIQGVWNSTYKSQKTDDWDKAIKFLAIKDNLENILITKRFKLEDGIKAFIQMQEKANINIKGVFENE